MWAVEHAYQLVSLSARRAWIEMTQFVPITTSDVVALRKESVDRNSCWGTAVIAFLRSLSARRAWIEIHLPVIL